MKKSILILLLGTILFSFKSDVAEEGIFPMSHLSKLDLKKAGLKIGVDEIYNESKPSLVNALVRLGGCTGSFISNEGLIITNHHCVFSAVASASTPEQNHLENGFYAETNDQEIKTSLPCKITRSFKDVSTEVLEGVDEISNAIEKQTKIKENIASIIEEEEAKFKDLTIEISEMLVGKSYTLFRYKMLNDVRLVYVPPKNIGKFGGETDNWEWPRHNGDFSIVRAYENGKPYAPEKFLEVNPAGTKDGDFTFILGYPGRTYRNQTAEFLTYQNDYVLPIIADWFDYKIDAIKEHAGNDVGQQLKYSGTLASLSNTSKNFKGKMQGLQRTDVIERTYNDQAYLKEYAESNIDLKSYVPLFDKNKELYERKFKLITDYLYLNQLYGTGVFSAAATISSYNNRFANMTKSEVNTLLDSNKQDVRKSFGTYFGIGNNESLDKTLFTELFYRLSQTSNPELREVFTSRIEDYTQAEIRNCAEIMFDKSGLAKSANGAFALDKKPKKFFKNKSELVKFAADINQVFSKMRGEMNEVNAGINEIIPRFNDLEMELNGDVFVPDANSTLRFTYGYVSGYEPEDAVVFSPFTTIEGILEKSIGSDNKDYFLQPEFIEKLQKTQPADVLKHPQHNSVVVAFLYNMDTTGGNSGSPIMDGNGRIVGVNFDRAYTATINDYAWNQSYSRSIGVDIRYVLYVMKYFGGADEVLAEMGVEL
ncbi:MAG: S46 family peptidase [Bacteroidia bacterium]|nr:S46 family peptidase [Bacteroidia bacterium]NNJ56286.1 S46 family peptidase [Bacteroidia bacterium]